MDSLSEQIREMIISNQLKISMSEVSRVTGVSTSQLRYWEKKGYIRSEQDEQNKLITLVSRQFFKYLQLRYS